MGLILQNVMDISAVGPFLCLIYLTIGYYDYGIITRFVSLTVNNVRQF